MNSWALSPTDHQSNRFIIYIYPAPLEYRLCAKYACPAVPWTKIEANLPTNENFIVLSGYISTIDLGRPVLGSLLLAWINVDPGMEK